MEACSMESVLQHFLLSAMAFAVQSEHHNAG